MPSLGSGVQREEGGQEKESPSPDNSGWLFSEDPSAGDML